MREFSMTYVAQNWVHNNRAFTVTLRKETFASQNFEQLREKTFTNSPLLKIFTKINFRESLFQLELILSLI